MARPREHGERTAAALLEAAERSVAQGGLGALSVRGVAGEVGTTTRAVYSLFGSKDGLVIALGTHAFNLLREAMDSLPTTDDPARDLVEAGAVVFRGFTLGHPALFAISLLREGVEPEIAREFWSVQASALARLEARIERLAGADRLGRRTVPDAVMEFHALCEGLAALELRGIMHGSDAERRWRDALRALVAGWRATGSAGGTSAEETRPS
jgi:AcrR family transcriptional regulator